MKTHLLQKLAGAALAVVAAAPVAAKLNSCDGPIVFGTTVSETGPFSTLADRWRKMTEVFAEEVNKTGGVAVKACNKKLPIQFVIYDDQSVPATAVSAVSSSPVITNAGSMRCAKLGKRKTSAYKPVSAVPSSLPRPWTPWQQAAG